MTIGNLRDVRGLTLLELMVVVALIAIPSAIPSCLDYQVSASYARASSDLGNAANTEEAYFLIGG